MRTGRHRFPGQELVDEVGEPEKGLGEPEKGKPGHRPWRVGRSIRARLLLMLAVPTGALVLLAATGVVAQIVAYRGAGSTVSVVQLVQVSQGYVHELQRERGLTNGLLSGKVEYQEQVYQQRRNTDVARSELDRALETAPEEVSTSVRGALASLASLGDLRAEVDAKAADPAQTLDFFTTAIIQITAASTTGQANLSDAELLHALDALRALSEAKESTALERGFLNGVFSADRFTGRQYTTFIEIRADKLARFNAFSGRATDTQQAALDNALLSPAARTVRVYEQSAIDEGQSQSLGLPAQPWWDSATTLVDDLRVLQQQVGSDAESRAVDLRSSALALLVLYSVLAVAALIGAAVLSVIAARSITRPLRLLASDAHHAATTRLPDTVARIQAADSGLAELPSQPEAVLALEQRHDEIAEVSQALNQMQRTAVDLASEQALLRRNAAESLSNLARRNQNLLRRQLGFISDLERDESDPAALANLFELDHLATRMRRNAESLLVLVGERSPRQWSQPVPIGDVVRAALSEVDEYRRVGLRRLDEALVVGAAGAELAHLLAELMENALSFSPPEREVEVYGQPTGTGYVIAVLDHGIGMSAEDLARANARLRGEETFQIAPTRFLGHYVIGRLARNLHVDVRLHESPLTGITARVTLPSSLLAPPTAGQEPAIAALQPAVPLEPPPVPTPRSFSLGRDSQPAARVAVLEPAPPPPPEPSPARTRNGLVKRVRAGESGEEPGPVLRSVIEQPTAAPRRSPADVRTTLANFRAGFERQENERAQAGDARSPSGDEGDRR